jgi:hypothetical protein
MTLEDLRDQALRQVQDTSGVRLTADNALLLLSEGQGEVSVRTGILRADTALSLSAGQAVYAVPDDFLYPLKIVRGDGAVVTPISWEWLADNYSLWITAEGPVQYVTGDFDSRGKIRVVPIPQVDDTLTITYARTPEDGELEVLEPDTLRHYCLWQFYLGEGPEQYRRAFYERDLYNAGLAKINSSVGRDLQRRASRRGTWF